jgi:hypothetical protein
MRTILLLWLIMTYCKTAGYAVANIKEDRPNDNHVFIITLDGFRWQELFNGADPALIADTSYTENSAAVKKFFWHRDKEQRRQLLMPFVWSVINKEGQLFGNRQYGNKVNVSNIYALSYPGYNEIFTGDADLMITSNKPIKNHNITLLEYLNNKPHFKNKVASFTSWDMFPSIFNVKRSKLFINSRNTLFQGEEIKASNNHDEDDASIRSDYSTYEAAKKYITERQPSVMHIGLSGTDAYGHKKQYTDYLFQAHLADNIIRWLWDFVQSMPLYHNRTTFVITTDHGRGNKKDSWYKHGLFVSGSSQTWMALLGNGIRSIGECKRPEQLYQSQLAGTIGYLLNVLSYRNYSLPVSYFKPTAGNKDLAGR